MKLLLGIIIGVLIGGGLMYMIFPSINKNLPASQIADTGSGSNSAQMQQNAKQLQQQYQNQGGVPLTATVASVYPGYGFILADANNTKIFVRWDKTMPTVGAQVTVVGKPADVAAVMNQWKSDSNVPSDLKNFLQNQHVYVQATTINPASGTPTEQPSSTESISPTQSQ